MALQSKPLPSPCSNSVWKESRVPKSVSTDTPSRRRFTRKPRLAATPTKNNGSSNSVPKNLSTSPSPAPRPRIGLRLFPFTCLPPSIPSRYSFVSRIEVAAANLSKWVLPPSRIHNRCLPYAPPKPLHDRPVDVGSIDSGSYNFVPKFTVKPRRPAMPWTPLRSDECKCGPCPTAMEDAPHDVPQASLLGCVETISRSIPIVCAPSIDDTASTSIGQTRDVDASSVLELKDAEAAATVADTKEEGAQEAIDADVVTISTVASVKAEVIPVNAEGPSLNARITSLDARFCDMDQRNSSLDLLHAAFASIIADSQERFPSPKPTVALKAEQESPAREDTIELENQFELRRDVGDANSILSATSFSVSTVFSTSGTDVFSGGSYHISDTSASTTISGPYTPCKIVEALINYADSLAVLKELEGSYSCTSGTLDSSVPSSHSTAKDTCMGGDEMPLADVTHVDVVRIGVLQDICDKHLIAPTQLITLAPPVVPILSHNNVSPLSPTKLPSRSPSKAPSRLSSKIPAPSSVRSPTPSPK